MNRWAHNEFHLSEQSSHEHLLIWNTATLLQQAKQQPQGSFHMHCGHQCPVFKVLILTFATTSKTLANATPGKVPC